MYITIYYYFVKVDLWIPIFNSFEVNFVVMNLWFDTQDAASLVTILTIRNLAEALILLVVNQSSCPKIFTLSWMSSKISLRCLIFGYNPIPVKHNFVKNSPRQFEDLYVTLKLSWIHVHSLDILCSYSWSPLLILCILEFL